MRLSRAPQVLHPDAIIMTNDGEDPTVWKGEHPDCFLTGELTSHNGTAAVSYCNGMMGHLTTSGHVIHFEEVPHRLRKRDTFSDLIHNLRVARKQKSKKEEKDYIESEDGEQEENDDDEDQDLSLSEDDLGDVIASERENGAFGLDNLDKIIASKRSAAPFDLTVEMGVFLDSTFTALLPKDNARRVEIMVIKYSGLAFEYSKSDQLGHNFKIQIKYMRFFEERPSWLSVYNMGSVVRSFRDGHERVFKFDLVYLHLGSCPRGGIVGMAYIGGMCTYSNAATDCAGIPNAFEAMAHEVGHTLNMRHDSGTSCDKSTYGVMGGNLGRFSPCSIQSMNSYLKRRSSKCLWTTNIPAEDVSAILQNVSVSTELVGQTYSAHEICRQLYGPGVIRRKPVRNMCNKEMQCLRVDRSQPDYGMYIRRKVYFPGEFCSEGNICYKSRCRPFSNAYLKDPEVRTGNWGEWSDWSVCSRTCGGGLKVRYRECNSPAPKNSPDCPGERSEQELCGPEPCADDPSRPVDIMKARASEYCQNLVDNGLLDPSVYSGRGNRKYNHGNDQCIAKCGKVDGRYVVIGLIPDGTPCTIDGRKWNKRCVMGYCKVV